MFALNLVFFTFHRWPDYQTMVTPAHFLFAVAIAAGLARLWVRGRRQRAAMGVAGVAVLAAVQLDRLPDVRAVQVESAMAADFVERALAMFPENAVVVARWRFFAPLVYTREVRGERPDVTLIERAEGRRRYPFGDVTSWRAFVAREIDARPVIVDTPDHGFGLHVAAPLDTTWHQLVRVSTSSFELPGTVSARPRGAAGGELLATAEPLAGPPGER
jgi:hypothetical protein